MPIILNDDVLHDIAGECSLSSLTNLCCVSTRFYAVTLPHLLRDVTRIDNPPSLRRFLLFIIDNSTSEWPEETFHASPSPRFKDSDPGKHVFFFKVGQNAWGNDFDPDTRGLPEEYGLDTWAPLLTRALSLMPNLRSVSIQSEFDSMCQFCPNISTILLRMPLLVDLELGNISSFASRSLEDAVRSAGSMDFKLKRISLISAIGFDTDGLRSLVLACRDTLEFLKGGQSDLQELLHGGGDSARSSTDSKAQVILPNVHTLSSDGCRLRLKDVALSFPSLRTWCTTTIRRNVGDMDRRISLPNLVSIGLYDFRSFRNLLQRIDPPRHLRRLALSSYCGDDNGDFATSSLIMQAMRGLKILSLEFDADRLHTSDVNALTVLIKSLSSLIYLSVTMESSIMDRLETLTKRTPQIFCSASMEYLSVSFRPSWPQNVDLGALALTYAQTVKSLKYLDICKPKTTCCRSEGRWWEIVHGESPCNEMESVKLEALREAQAMAIKDGYEKAIFHS